MYFYLFPAPWFINLGNAIYKLKYTSVTRWETVESFNIEVFSMK